NSSSSKIVSSITSSRSSPRSSLKCELIVIPSTSTPSCSAIKVQILFVRDTSSRAEIRRDNGKLFMNRPPLVQHLHIQPIYPPSNVTPWNKFASVALTTARPHEGT